jgi:hypothetical protein
MVICTQSNATTYRIGPELLRRMEKTEAKRKAETEEMRFQRESGHWKSYCRYRKDGFNNHDISPLITKLRGVVAEDLVAEGAMDIFLAASYWDFTDYCVARLSLMSELNQQRFKEILILLAPGLESSRYTARAVELVGRNQRGVRAADFQHLSFCLDMLFYGAIINAQWGRYTLANMCEDAFLAPFFDRRKDPIKDRLLSLYDRNMIFDGCCFDDWPEIHYFIDNVWPNWTA